MSLRAMFWPLLGHWRGWLDGDRLRRTAPGVNGTYTRLTVGHGDRRR